MLPERHSERYSPGFRFSEKHILEINTSFAVLLSAMNCRSDADPFIHVAMTVREFPTAILPLMESEPDPSFV